jgi:mono/diheme cytochrome c family protein
MRRSTLLLLLPLVAALLSGCSQESKANREPGSIPPATAKQNVTFATDIKPIFDRACLECHGPKKQKGGLRLDSLEATIHGSDDGPVLELGQGATSMIVSNIAHVGLEDDWMPPLDEGKPLSQEEVALVRAWIDQGAK